MKQKTLIFIFIAILFLILRIIAGRLVGVGFIPFSGWDDALMIQYSHLKAHFLEQNNLPYYAVMVKEMGFPLFLNLLSKTGIVYTDAISLIWFLSAVSFTALFAYLTQIRRKEILLFIYVFVLFMPATFSYIGFRLYRNSTLVPFYFLLITLMVTLFAMYWKKLELSLNKRILFSVILGILFSWVYYMKEDGIWLLMCLVAVIVACLIHKFFLETQSPKEKFYHALILFLPLAIFFSCTTAYKSVNEHFFGVNATNNRTNGELGQFIKYIHKIKSDDRTGKIWAPADAVMKAFDASETLKKNVELKNTVLRTNWFSEGGKYTIFEKPIPGDFLGWVMLTSLSDSKTCSSLAEQEAYLKQVNQELKTAFENGTLEKDDKFQISSSMGGLTLAEIFQLKKRVAEIFIVHVLLYHYAAPVSEERIFFEGYDDNSLSYEEEVIRFKAIIEDASDVININLFEKNKYHEEATRFASITIWIYRVLNGIMFIAAFIGLILAVKKIIGSSLKDSFNVALIAVITMSSLLLATVYALAISWYCQYLEGWPPILFYGIGMIPLLTIFEIFGTYLFLTSIKKFS